MSSFINNEPTYLKFKNPHKRDNYIIFNEALHKYKVIINNQNNEILYDENYTSVTTWIHSHFSHFDADSIIEKMMNSRKWPQNKYFGLSIQEIKDLWEENRKKSAEEGTNMHYEIECFYNNKEIYNQENQSYKKFLEELLKKDISKEFNYFINFEKNRINNFGSHLTPYRTEWIVYDEHLKISGSIDMVYMRDDGDLEIFDWKRSKEIKKFNPWQNALTECIQHLPDTNYWHYALQLNIYKMILERKYDKKVKKLYLVCLHPNNNNYLLINVPILKQEIDDLIKYRLNELNKEK